MKPLFRGAPQYLRFLITTASAGLLALDVALRRTSAVLPPSMAAWASPLPAFQVISPSAVDRAFHLTGYRCPTIATIASRCGLLIDLSNVTTAQSISLSEKSPPRSPAAQNFTPSSFTPL